MDHRTWFINFADLWNPVCEGYSSNHAKTGSKLNFTYFEAVRVLVCVYVLGFGIVLNSMAGFIMNNYILLSIPHTSEQNITLFLMQFIF